MPKIEDLLKNKIDIVQNWPCVLLKEAWLIVAYAERFAVIKHLCYLIISFSPSSANAALFLHSFIFRSLNFKDSNCCCCLSKHLFSLQFPTEVLLISKTFTFTHQVPLCHAVRHQPSHRRLLCLHLPAQQRRWQGEKVVCWASGLCHTCVEFVTAQPCA